MDGGVAAQRTLRFLLKIDSDISEAERDIARLEQMIESVNQMRGTANVGLDGIEKVTMQIETVRMLLESLGDEVVRVSIDFDFDREKLLGALTDLMAEADQTLLLDVEVHEDAFEKLEAALENFQERAVVFANFDISEDEMREFRERLDDLGSENKIKIELDVDHTGVEDLRRSLNDVRDMSAYAMIGVVKSSLADIEIENLERELREFAAKSYKATISVDTEASMEKFREFFEAVESVTKEELVATIDVAILEALEKIREVSERLRAIERTYIATLDIDNQRALDKIRYFLKRLQQVDDAKAEPVIDPETNDARLQTGLFLAWFKSAVGNTTAEAKAQIDDEEAKEDLRGFQDMIRRYNRRWGREGIRARITMDIRQSVARLSMLENMLENIEDDEHRVLVEAEVTRAQQELAALRAAADATGARSPDITVRVRGFLASMAQMAGLQALADRLDGTSIDMGANIDDRLSRALPNMLGALELQIRQLNVVTQAASAVRFPAMYASLGLLPGAISSVAGGLGALIIQLGQGLAGAVGTGVGAMGLAVPGLLTFANSIRQVGDYSWNLTENLREQQFAVEDATEAVAHAKARLEDAEKGTQGYRDAVKGLRLAQQNQRTEQEKMNAMLESVTPRLLKVNAKFGEFQVTMIRVKAAMADAAAPAVMAWLDMLNQRLPQMLPHMTEMVGRQSEIVVGFFKMAQSGQNLRSIQTILMGIKDSAGPVMNILTRGLLVLANVFAVITPSSVKLLQTLSGMVTKAHQWTASAEGQSRMAEIWSRMYSTAVRLWGIAVDLGHAIWGVIVALNQSGVGQWLFAQIERGAAAFRELMREGGKGRQAITQFVRDSRPVLAAMGGAIWAVVKAFGILAGEALNLRMEGSKQRVLVAVFNEIKTAILGTENSAGILGLLRHELKEIGPMLPGLIREMATWFTTFAKAEPEMRIFIRTFIDLLEKFNNLPEPVRRGMARILAWTMAIKILGGGAILGAVTQLGTLAIQAILVRHAFGPIGIFGKFGGAIKKMGSAIMWVGRTALPWLLRGLVGLIGVPGLIIAAIATAAILIWKNWDWLVKQFEKLPMWIAGPLHMLTLGIQLVVAIIGGIITGDWSKLMDVWARTKDVVVYAFGWLWDWFKNIDWVQLGQDIVDGFASVVTGETLQAIFEWAFTALWDWITGWWETGSESQKTRRLGEDIMAGLSNAIRDFDLGATIRGAFSGAFNFMKNQATGAVNAVKNRFNQLPPNTRQAVSGVGSAMALGGNIIRGAVTGNWQPAINNAKNMWRSLPPGVRQRLAPLGPALRNVGGIMKGVVTGNWGQVANQAQQLWQKVPPGTRAKLAPIGGVLRNIGGMARGVVTGNWGGVANHAMQLWQKVPPGTRARLAPIGGVMKNIGGIARGIVTGNWNQTSQQAIALWQKVPPGTRSKLAPIGGVVRGAGAVVRGIFTGQWGPAITMAVNLFNQLPPGVRSRISSAVSAAASFTSNFVQTGRDLIQGLINGILGMGQAAATAVGNLLRNAYEAGKRAIQSGSPSRLFMYLGRSTGEGYVLAVQDQIAAARDAVRRLLTSGGDPDAARAAMNRLRAVQANMARTMQSEAHRQGRSVGQAYADGMRREMDMRRHIANMRRDMAMGAAQLRHMRGAGAPPEQIRAAYDRLRTRQRQMVNTAQMMGREHRMGVAPAPARPGGPAAPRGGGDVLRIQVEFIGPGAENLNEDQVSDMLSRRINHRNRRG